MNLMEYVLRLKETPREGWVRKGIPSPENVASHSYSTAMLAYLLAKSEGQDADRAVKMALVHDLGEAVTGDIISEHLSKEERREKNHAELQILRDILEDELLELAEEYFARDSPTARIVKEADVLEMVFQAARYSEQHAVRLDEFYRSAEPHVLTETGKRLFRKASGAVRDPAR